MTAGAGPARLLARELDRHPGVRWARVDADRDGRLVATVEVEPAWRAAVGPHRRVRLPNGMHVVQQRDYETAYLYEEIFTEHSYLRHGVVLPPDAVVLDVGANIGLFTLYAVSVCPTARVHAFEPAPALYELLRTNLGLYAPGAGAVHCGVDRADGERTFTFYPNSSVFSRFDADLDVDGPVLRKVVENAVTDQGPVPGFLVDQLLEDRLRAETSTVRTRSLTSLIAELGLDRVDLLKVDAERSELDVLAGLDDAGWDAVGQVVLECHGSTLRSVVDLLRVRGFRTTEEEVLPLRGTGLVNVYATRSPAVPVTPVVPASTGPGVVDEEVVRTLAARCGLGPSLPLRVDLR